MFASPWQYAFVLCLVAGLLAILFRLLIVSTRSATTDDSGGLPPRREPRPDTRYSRVDDPETEVLERARERFRDGGTMAFGRGNVGFRPSVRKAAVSQVHLTPRNLSAINARRRAHGYPPLNRRGFQAAIAAAPTRYSTNHDDWVAYLILYECLFADHQGRTPDTAISITPDAPFNGQGGTFAGAGASGDWASEGEPTPAIIEPRSHGGVALGLGLAGAAVAGAAEWGGDDGNRAPSVADPLSDPGSFKGDKGDEPLHDGGLPPPGGAAYQGNDPQWGADPSNGNPEAYSPPQSASEPNYSAPDPSPSYDSGGSSSSYDSGGSSGGGDSGGGGGGSD